jgi:hypothetical protein
LLDVNLIVVAHRSKAFSGDKTRHAKTRIELGFLLTRVFVMPPRRAEVSFLSYTRPRLRSELLQKDYLLGRSFCFGERDVVIVTVGCQSIASHSGQNTKPLCK